MKHIVAIAASVIGASFLPSMAMAQQAAEPVGANPTPAGDAAKNAAYGDIVVTAQRRSEKLRDVPLTIVAQSGADLARAGVTSTRELSVLVPGLSFGSTGALSQPSIRGVQSTAGGAGSESPIAVYIDGFYQPNQVGSLTDLPDVSQIEVLKGPQGTLFGRNATGGAISIHTKEPSLTTVTGSITASEGVFVGRGVKTSSDATAKGFISVPLVKDELALSVAGYYNNVAGYYTNDRTGGRANPIRTYLARAKLLFEPSSSVRFLLSGMISRRADYAASSLLPLNGVTAAAAINPVTGLPVYPDAIIPTQPWHAAGESAHPSVATTTYRTIDLTSDFTFAAAGKLTSRTGYSYVGVEIFADVDASYAPSCVAVVACQNYVYDYGPSRTFQQEFSFASNRFGIFSFVAGGQYFHDDQRQLQNVNPPFSADGNPERNIPGVVYNRKEVKTDAYAGFGELYLDPTDNLRFVAGIRYSDEKKEGRLTAGKGPPLIPGLKSQAWTPRFSALYRLNSEINLYATYSKGFKSGILNADTGAPPALPEHLTSYEAGVKIGTQRFNLNASGFYYDYSNLQVQFNNGTSVFVNNAAKARIIGVDVDAGVKLTPSFKIRVAGSYLPTAKYLSYPDGIATEFPLGPRGLKQVIVNATGTRILKAPRFTGSFVANYDHDIDMGTLDASATVYHASSSKWDLVDRVKTNSYVTFGAQVGFTPRNTNIRIALWGKNLTNQAHIAGTTLSKTADAVIYAAPREVGVSAEYKF